MPLWAEAATWGRGGWGLRWLHWPWGRRRWRRSARRSGAQRGAQPAWPGRRGESRRGPRWYQTLTRTSTRCDRRAESPPERPPGAPVAQLTEGGGQEEQAERAQRQHQTGHRVGQTEGDDTGGGGGGRHQDRHVAQADPGRRAAAPGGEGGDHGRDAPGEGRPAGGDEGEGQLRPGQRRGGEATGDGGHRLAGAAQAGREADELAQHEVHRGHQAGERRQADQDQVRGGGEDVRLRHPPGEGRQGRQDEGADVRVEPDCHRCDDLHPDLLLRPTLRPTAWPPRWGPVSAAPRGLVKTCTNKAYHFVKVVASPPEGVVSDLSGDRHPPVTGGLRPRIRTV